MTVTTSANNLVISSLRCVIYRFGKPTPKVRKWGNPEVRKP